MNDMVRCDRMMSFDDGRRRVIIKLFLSLFLPLACRVCIGSFRQKFVGQVECTTRLDDDRSNQLFPI